MLLRPSYLEAVTPFIDQPLVEILAGVRRCRKSTIFQMLAYEFRRRGVLENRIIQKRYTEMDIPSDISTKDMYDDLKTQLQAKGSQPSAGGNRYGHLCHRLPLQTDVQ